MDDTEITTVRNLTNQFALLRRQLFSQHRETLKVSVLTEELRERWQQLTQWDDQVDKWMASYAIAMAVGISWLLSSEHITELPQFFSGRSYDNSYFILSLALVNSTYILYVTFKAYQIHQLRLYIYEKISKELNDLTEGNANSWELWHRTEFQRLTRRGKPEWRRVLYYPIMTISPFGVSAYVLWTYFHYVGGGLGRFDAHNVYFYFVVVMQFVALLLSFSTTVFNGKWKRLIDQEPRDNSENKNEPAKDVFRFEQSESRIDVALPVTASNLLSERNINDKRPSVKVGRGALCVMASLILVACTLAALKGGPSSEGRE